MSRSLTLAVVLAAAACGVAVTAKDGGTPPNPGAMSIKEIRVHNSTLLPDDPQFIVCKREDVTGSLAKKSRICLTKEVWAARADRARDWTVEALNRGMRACSSPNGAPCQ
jgi:hypothetical protein